MNVILMSGKVVLKNGCNDSNFRDSLEWMFAMTIIFMTSWIVSKDDCNNCSFHDILE